MPYVEGETLRDRLARGGELPIPEAARLLGEIADALSVAHRAGVVHRDIKPENVLLSGRHAMVMDFGVAKAVSEASGASSSPPRAWRSGTPLHGAGTGLGRPPHGRQGGHLRHGCARVRDAHRSHALPGLNPQQTLAAHVDPTPIPVGQQRDGLSPALEAVVMRCLAKRPADRFQTGTTW